MSIVSSIYKAPIVKTIEGPILGHITIQIKYNGKMYFGAAYCNFEDKEFMSKKVGSRIAESRARSNIMKDTLRREFEAWKIKRGFYGECKGFVDRALQDKMENNLNKQEKRIRELRRAIYEENKSLTLYLKSQDDFVKRVKKIRSKDGSK